MTQSKRVVIQELLSKEGRFIDLEEDVLKKNSIASLKGELLFLLFEVEGGRWQFGMSIYDSERR